ncbi:hypothetical protein AB4254_07920 [Vibrio breoganii]
MLTIAEPTQQYDISLLQGTILDPKNIDAESPSTADFKELIGWGIFEDARNTTLSAQLAKITKANKKDQVNLLIQINCAKLVIGGITLERDGSHFGESRISLFIDKNFYSASTLSKSITASLHINLMAFNSTSTYLDSNIDDTTFSLAMELSGFRKRLTRGNAPRLFSDTIYQK